VTATLAETMFISKEDRVLMLPSGQQTIFANRVGWAKTYLKNAGLLSNPSRGKVQVTEAGRRALGQNPERIDNDFLEQFPSFVEFKCKRSDSDEPQTSTPTSDTPLTPLELLDSSYQQLIKVTVEDLLTKIKEASPAFFERTVVKLLRAMGYGISGDSVTTGKPGDGGIDGVIREDKLGLDVVCIQAKRWEGPVGRPVVQGFVGSMDYYKATKGVIITTSYFTADATEFVSHIQGKRVVLIDGEQVAKLMMAHNVGVTTTKLYELKEVSHDFFDEDDG
jgi:restriction system protein